MLTDTAISLDPHMNIRPKRLRLNYGNKEACKQILSQVTKNASLKRMKCL